MTLTVLDRSPYRYPKHSHFCVPALRTEQPQHRCLAWRWREAAGSPLACSEVRAFLRSRCPPTQNGLPQRGAHSEPAHGKATVSACFGQHGTEPRAGSGGCAEPGEAWAAQAGTADGQPPVPGWGGGWLQVPPPHRPPGTCQLPRAHTGRIFPPPSLPPPAISSHFEQQGLRGVTF